MQFFRYGDVAAWVTWAEVANVCGNWMGCSLRFTDRIAVVFAPCVAKLDSLPDRRKRANVEGWIRAKSSVSRRKKG